MSKTILITGSTDGLGLATAQRLLREGHRVLLHGRSAAKLRKVTQDTGARDSYAADLSSIAGARDLAQAVLADVDRLDVLINNAGVYKVSDPITLDGFDLRFTVNTIAPYALTRALLQRLGPDARVVNLSSAAQAPYDLAALRGEKRLDTHEAYAQSKLALTAWTMGLAEEHASGPSFYAVNPGSLLATSMVKEGFGVSGKDIGIGVDILVRAALSAEFDGQSGAYYDNDIRAFSAPHPFATERKNRETLMKQLQALLD
ncbi:MAG: SDR family NAD(P)-dependent oxidoreductase [Pseudomonadota bacterium]